LAFFWFMAGILFTVAIVVLLLPWLRTVPRLGALPSLPWQAGLGAAILIVAVLALYHEFGSPDGRPDLVSRSAAPAAPAVARNAAIDTGIASAISAANSGSAAGPAAPAGASSMNSAIATLEGRLAKGGGSADDWELLAKSYEFLGRPADAAKARAHELPPLPAEANESVAGPGISTAVGTAAGTAAGTAVSGEVSIAAGLSAKAAAGETLFIVAKSIDSPGIPVAVFRTSVGAWPVKFTLDDSKSMFPGRTLSNAGRVTVEARISKSGQPLPAPGDLQGSTGPINPADHPVLKILIDRTIT
jgi:hypothetical protein